MTTRKAARKKLANKFKVGDVVTWGHKFVAHVVVQVTDKGVWVDTAGWEFCAARTFVGFAPGNKKESGPPVHTTMKPDYPLWRLPLHPNFKK